MSRWTRNDDFPDDESEFDDDREDPDWPDEDDEETTVPCPYCGREIYDEVLQCPHCENYLSAEDSPPAQKPWWLILGAVAGLYAVYRWIVWYNGPGP